MYGVKRKQEF